MDQSNVEEQKYGRCVECEQINTGPNWCQACNSKKFQKNFNNWASGNDDVDRFIQNNQLSAKNRYQLLEWIPYDRFFDVNYIAKGGFGKIYNARWKDGHLSCWNLSKNKWERKHPHNQIVLRTLNNSQNLTLEFIDEV
jgi:hypothetical protein